MSPKADDADGALEVVDTAPASPAAVAGKGEAARGRDGGFREVRAGERLGRYQIDEAIGEGGMAQVFRARDPELRRDVAIKVLFPHLSRRADVVRRFHREARAAARLRHPAILQTYDVGGGEGGEPPYIVMELVRGASLQEHAAAAPLLSELVACAGAVIAEALAVAHEAGVIHRDLKPANLLVTDDGRLLLADFGVAHVERDESLATRTGTVLGTPAYMSPEQASGEEVDARSDLYSLGATLYHLATGAVPYSGPPMKVMSQLATPGSLVAPQARRPSVGRPLSAAIALLMAHQAASRPASARAAAAMLRALAAPLGEAGAAVDPAQELAAYLRAPEAYLARQTPRVVASLVEESRRARAAGKLASSIALADRASALAPDDDAVKQLVREVTSRQAGWRRWRLGALALGLAGAAAATVWVIGRGEGGGAGDGDAERGAQVAPEGGAASPEGSSSARGGGEATASPGGASSEGSAASPEGSSREGSAASSERGGAQASASRPGSGPRSGSPPRGPSSGSGSAAKRGSATGSARPERSGSPASGDGSPSVSASSGAAGSSSAARPQASPAVVAVEPAVVAPAAMASVTFAMDAWCELFIDGKSQGRADRAKPIALSAGNHSAECTQGPGLGRWRGELVLSAGEARQVTGELSLEVKVLIDVTGSAVAVGGKELGDQKRVTLRNGRHHVVVRQGAREVASGWVSIPRVAACTLRDQPQLDCYP